MPITISNAARSTFEDNLRHLAQQQDMRLQKACTSVFNQSLHHNWDFLAASAARINPGPRAVSPAGGDGSGAVGATDGLTYNRRRTNVVKIDTGEVVESEDITTTITDPRYAVTENLAMNMNRGRDDRIISAFDAAADDGAGGTVAFPAGQIIGDGTGVITLDTVLEVRENLQASEAWGSAEFCWFYSSVQERKLMQLMEVVSGDYQNSKGLATGDLPNFLGFKWIRSERLVAPLGGEIHNIVFSPKGMGLHIAKDVSAEVGQRTDMSFAWQLYCEQHIDAVRLDDSHCVRVHLKDAIV